MQQAIRPSEACALLDQVLRTLQTINQVVASISVKPKEMRVIAQPEPVMEQRKVVQLVEEHPVSPVLTIKLADLIREGSAARDRRNQHIRPQRAFNTRPQPRPQPKPQVRPRSMYETRTIEVMYKRTHKMAS